MNSRIITSAAIVALLATAGCTHKEEKTVVVQPAAPTVGSLNRTLNMVDSDGKIYGTVEMDPVGGGRVVDSSGRTIGKIVAPERY